MHDEHGNEHKDLLENLGYETHDVDYKGFTTYGMYFLGFFVACIILGFGFMWLMVPTKLSGGKMGDYVPKTTPPLATPLLQSNITARTDIMSLRRNETAVLDSSAVVDKAHGVYRVPVDQAIDDVVNMSDSQKSAVGLPPSAAGGSNPVTITSETDGKGNPVMTMSQGDETLKMHLEPAGKKGGTGG
jgi:hypothetical protein